MPFPRRTVDEWVTYFELEPAINHVFVEGETDRWLIAGLLAALRAGTTDVALATDMDITIPPEEMTPFNSGNRARLVTFADKITQKAARPLDNVRCVIDRDFDTLLPYVAPNRLVLRTDFVKSRSNQACCKA